MKNCEASKHSGVMPAQSGHGGSAMARSQQSVETREYHLRWEARLWRYIHLITSAPASAGNEVVSEVSQGTVFVLDICSIKHSSHFHHQKQRYQVGRKRCWPCLQIKNDDVSSS